MIKVSMGGRRSAPCDRIGVGRTALSAVAASAVMVLAMLGAGQTRAATTGVELPTGVVAEYARTFATSTEGAEANLRLQQEGAPLGELLRRVMGESFGGLWFDNAAGQFVVPVPSSADRDAVTEAVEALGLSPGSVRLAPVASRRSPRPGRNWNRDSSG